MTTNLVLYETLHAMGNAYQRGDFSKFVSYLAEDCVYESMWVLAPLRGYASVSAHLIKKGESMRKADACPDYRIVELMGNMNPIPNTEIKVNGEKKQAAFGLMYEPGKLCLMLEQDLEDESNDVLVDLTLDQSGKIARIDLCMPRLFNYRDFDECISFYPGRKDDYNESMGIYVSNACFDELRLFFDISDSDFYLYDDTEIPMDTWKKVLNSWKAFVEAKDYDSVFEEYTKADYNSWTVEMDHIYFQMCMKGAQMWNNRTTNAAMLKMLIQWTEECANSCECDHIFMIGW